MKFIIPLRFTVASYLLILLCIYTPFRSVYSGVSIAESNWLQVDLRSDVFINWLQIYYSTEEINDVRLTDFSSDTDGDGNINYFEFIAKLDPTDSEERFKIYFVGENRDKLRVGLIKGDVQYEVQYSIDLNSWTAIDVNLYQTIGDEFEVDLISMPSNTFYRVVVLE